MSADGPAPADRASDDGGPDDTAVVWFRRDLRVQDQAMFLTAAEGARGSLGLFVLDPALLGPSGAPRRTVLYRCLRALDESLGGRLLVVRGDPADAVPRVAAAVDASQVHVAADFGPYGRTRDEAVEKALAGDGRALVRTGSPYAVAPGRVTKPDGTPYRVFTPFSRAWQQHGWRRPADTDAGTLAWIDPADKHGGPGSCEHRAVASLALVLSAGGPVATAFHVTSCVPSSSCRPGTPPVWKCAKYSWLSLIVLIRSPSMICMW